MLPPASPSCRWGEKMKMTVFLLGFSPPLAYCELGMVAAEQGSPGTGLEPWTCSGLFHRFLCFRLVVPQFPHLSKAGANLCPPFPHLQCSWGPLGELRGLRWGGGLLSHCPFPRHHLALLVPVSPVTTLLALSPRHLITRFPVMPTDVMCP